MKTAQYIADKLIPLLSDYQRKQLRINDITEMTEDPGNTELLVALYPFALDEAQYESGTSEIKPLELQEQLQEVFDSSGDHHEEIMVSTQNNEYLIIFNFNK